MEFELKSVSTIGGVKEVDENNSSQSLGITIGVVGCTYNDIISTRFINYVFSNEITVTAALAGVDTFASSWVAENYPSI